MHQVQWGIVRLKYRVAVPVSHFLERQVALFASAQEYWLDRLQSNVIVLEWIGITPAESARPQLQTVQPKRTLMDALSASEPELSQEQLWKVAILLYVLAWVGTTLLGYARQRFPTAKLKQTSTGANSVSEPELSPERRLKFAIHLHALACPGTIKIGIAKAQFQIAQ